jgi:glycosyltransferase involved in cell wall biosynthesis
VSQLEGPPVFCERVLLIDSLRDNYTRQYAESDFEGLCQTALKLVDYGLIDRVIYGPIHPEKVSQIQMDWFGMNSTETHSLTGAPLASPLYAFEQCSGKFILQVDSDLLIHRSSPREDYLEEMVKAIEDDPKAITASLSIAQPESSPPGTGDKSKPWRMEARGCLLHKERLLAARPFINEIKDKSPLLSWHRAVDEKVKAGTIHSLRGHCKHAWFVHPENELKRARKEWMLMLDLVEKGFSIPAQFGKVNLVGVSTDWVPSSRNERFVFLITGRNVPPGRMARCLDSLLRQKQRNWGAIIIDDASDARIAANLRLMVNPYQEKITLLQPRERRGQMANLIIGIRHICTNPESVIVTLDLDDCLIGTGVICRLVKEYDNGADVTIGSMLRTDKCCKYPVELINPRAARGGNVWQHLRSFKKKLFDKIPDHYLRLDSEYVPIASDWAFMLPIVEMSKKPVWIRDELYLYETSGEGKGDDRLRREQCIARIISKPRIKHPNNIQEPNENSRENPSA